MVQAKSLMIQGTGSYAGKSILTAALCRILLQDGVRVAPFKAQNMSLNSYVTQDGKEMGRAQVVQAQAARLEPDVRMNPILLKPTSDTVCQVIAQGVPVKNMNVKNYFNYHTQAFSIAKQSYDSLAAEYDVIILEGAGSPAEVNLMDRDFVNMAMAYHAAAPVLIVGDIDRGGVFAAFVGTYEVLPQKARDQIGGFVINKFRGDESLLAPALEYTKQRTNIPVLGTIPYIPEIHIPEEDGVEFPANANSQARHQSKVEIAVLDLPHISNFTDLDALRAEPDVEIKVIRTLNDFHQPDAVIIPGSKNTIQDLAYLKTSGLAEHILKLAKTKQLEIIGICAGFQMLGQEIRDPQSIESFQNQITGLGLLPMQTELGADKILTRTSAKHAASGLEVFGYEIHHGRTTFPNEMALFFNTANQPLGAAAKDQKIWGTYLHGIFDADNFRRWWIDRLRINKGLLALGQTSVYSIEPALDHLANVVRKNLQMEKIYRLLNIK